MFAHVQHFLPVRAKLNKNTDLHDLENLWKESGMYVGVPNVMELYPLRQRFPIATTSSFRF
jgi:hypothetical protein